MASRKHRPSRVKTLSPDVGSISLAEWAKLPLRDRLLHVEHVTAKWVQERVAIDGKKWRGEGENGLKREVRGCDGWLPLRRDLGTEDLLGDPRDWCIGLYLEIAEEFKIDLSRFIFRVNECIDSAKRKFADSSCDTDLSLPSAAGAVPIGCITKRCAECARKHKSSHYCRFKMKHTAPPASIPPDALLLHCTTDLIKSSHDNSGRGSSDGDSDDEVPHQLKRTKIQEATNGCNSSTDETEDNEESEDSNESLEQDVQQSSLCTTMGAEAPSKEEEPSNANCSTFGSTDGCPPNRSAHSPTNMQHTAADPTPDPNSDNANALAALPSVWPAVPDESQLVDNFCPDMAPFGMLNNIDISLPSPKLTQAIPFTDTSSDTYFGMPALELANSAPCTPRTFSF